MMLHFLNDVANDAESTKIENYVIIASLKSKTMGKLINRIPGSRLLISSLPGSALRTHVESLSKPCNVHKPSQSFAGKLDHKRHSPSILHIFGTARIFSTYHISKHQKLRPVYAHVQTRLSLRWLHKAWM